jgi:predicted nucleic acid-binding protein
MKVIFDTNVFISAVLRDRNPEAVIVWVVDQPGWQWIVSGEILREYRDVLHRKKFSFSAEILKKWVQPLFVGDNSPVSGDMVRWRIVPSFTGIRHHP